MNGSHAAADTNTGIPSGKLGMWVFLASEVMLFGGFISSYVILRTGSTNFVVPGKEMLGVPLAMINTFVLITSSVTMVLALDAIEKGNVKGLVRNLIFTLILAACFLGIKSYEYPHKWREGITISSGLFGSFYYTLTGLHMLHVLGGMGFIGSHLCDRFLARGARVYAIDNFLTGNEKNIAHLRTNPDFELIRHDVSKHIDFKGPVHFVLHFASPASPLDYLQFPIQTLKVGALGTHNALGLAKEKRAAFLLASTSEVYGDPLVHPQPEDYWGNVNPIGPRGVYDEAKRFAEAITMAYHRSHKVDTKIIRIFNTYGPRMRVRDGRAIPAFLSQVLTGEPLTVFGDGKQTRSLCYIDMVNGIEKLLMSNINEPINIGTPVEISMLDLAKKIIEMTGSKCSVVHKDLPVDDPKVRKPDITKAQKLLGWAPAVPLDEGLERTIEYFKTAILSV